MKHRMALRSGLGLIVLLAALCGGAQRAQAGLHFCNDSAADWLEIAISHPDGAGGWTAEGWWRIERGQCRTVITGPLTSRFYYFLANGPGGAWFSGETPYCIQTKKFTLNQTQFGRPGERDPADCAQAGLQFAKFREMNTNDSKDFTNRLSGNPPPNLSAAPPQPPAQPVVAPAPPQPTPSPAPPQTGQSPARFGPPTKYPGLGEIPQRSSQAPGTPPQQQAPPSPVAPGGGGEACKRYPNLC